MSNSKHKSHEIPYRYENKLFWQKYEIVGHKLFIPTFCLKITIQKQINRTPRDMLITLNIIYADIFVYKIDFSLSCTSFMYKCSGRFLYHIDLLFFTVNIIREM